MVDTELIDKVAELWVELGGDADGVAWCWRDLQNRVDEITHDSNEGVGNDGAP